LTTVAVFRSLTQSEYFDSNNLQTVADAKKINASIAGAVNRDGYKLLDSSPIIAITVDGNIVHKDQYIKKDASVVVQISPTYENLNSASSSSSRSSSSASSQSSSSTMMSSSSSSSTDANHSSSMNDFSSSSSKATSTSSSASSNTSSINSNTSSSFNNNSNSISSSSSSNNQTNVPIIGH
jgi:hypothetical protein